MSEDREQTPKEVAAFVENHSVPLGTTAEHRLAEFAEHLEADLFDILGDVPDDDVPVEPELDLTKPIVNTPTGPDEVTVTWQVGGKPTAINLTRVQATTGTSKSSQRQMIVALLATKPTDETHKVALHAMMLAAVAHLDELVH